MFKKLLLTFALAISLVLIWGQGTENFEGVVLPGTYSDGSFVGNGGITWTYGHSRDQATYPINGNGLMLRRASDSFLQATIPGGIGTFTFQYRKAYTGAAARQLELYVNGSVVQTSAEYGAGSGEDATIHTFTATVNTNGNVTVKIKNVGIASDNKQTTLDNISWTAYSGAPTPVISVSGTLNPFNTEVGIPSVAQIYTLSGTALTGNLQVAAPAGFEISSTGSSYASSLSLAPTYNGQVYVRLTAAAEGTFSGNITHNSSGAAQVTLAASGNVTAATPPPPPGTFLEENFAYTAGTTLVSNGWEAHSGTGDNSPTVTNYGLSYAGYPPNSGFAGQTLGNGEDVNKAFPAQTTASVYTSFLINVTSATTAGDYTYHFVAPNSTSDFKGKFFVSRNETNQIRFGVTKSANVGSAVAWTGYNYALGTTYLVVMKYQFVAGTANDIVTAWINPAIGATEPAPMLSAVVTETDIAATGIGAIALRQSTNTPVAVFDGIRVTNNWAGLWSGEAPPEPVIIVSGEPAPLYCIAGSPSDEHSEYQLSGEHLSGPINVLAPNHFEISTDALEWHSSLQLAATFDGSVYVRLNALAVGAYAGNITHNSSGAQEVLMRVEGEALPPAVIWNITNNMTAFSATAGDPAPVQSYTLSATNADANIQISVTEGPFEISSVSANGPWSTGGSLSPSFHGTIYVRMLTTLAGSFGGQIKHSTTNASDAYVNVSGTVNPPAGVYATDLFISEYIEGSSNNKALEVFNGTGVPVDLSHYRLVLFSNGSGTATNPALLSGTLAHGDVYVVANAGAAAAIQAVADMQSTVTYFNGDDAVALQKQVNEEWVNIDIFGMIGQRPTLAWTAPGGYSTLDKTLVRKANITQGVSVNPIGYAAGDVNAFETLATQWDVYPVDTFSFLGAHVFTPGMQPASAPVILPAGGLKVEPINVSMSSSTPGASIYYTLDGSLPGQSSTLYQAPFVVSSTTTVKAIAYAAGFSPSAVTEVSYLYPTPVSNIAALRAMPTGGNNVYRLTGQAVLTYKNANRHTKYIQDNTAALVIDDYAGIITTQYNLFDGITGLTGTLALYSGLLQFTPVADPGAPTSTGNVVIPELRTLASLTPADQAKLIKVMNVTIDASSGNFVSTAQNINVTDPTTTLVMRTFPNTDYSETAIPTEAVNLTCLVGQFNTTMQVSPRFLADFQPAGSQVLTSPVLSISQASGMINVSWQAVSGATSYRVYSSSTPHGVFDLIGTVNSPNFSEAATGRKFYYVIAQ